MVNANVLGVPLPFVGVDGTDACSKIYEEDGTTKAGCNFEKGKTYVFKDNIDVLQIYPRVSIYFVVTNHPVDIKTKFLHKSILLKELGCITYIIMIIAF